MPSLTKLPCNQVDLPIPLNLVHFLIRNSATEFDVKAPSHLFFGPFLGIHNQLGFSGILNLIRIVNLSRLWNKASICDASNASALWATVVGSTRKSLRK
jgi:hypothetical protein